MRPSEKSLRFNLSTMKAVAFLGLSFALVVGAFRAHAGEAPAVRANYAAFSGAFAPLWIAADRNLFSKYGLNVDLRYIAPATATQALIGKNLEIINPGGEIVEAGLNGEPVVYIAGIMNRAVMSIYAKPEIGSLADLKGKVLAVTVPGATTDFAARLLLQQARLTPGKDVKLIYLKGMVEILTGINQGNADAGIFTSPTTLKAQHAGLKELVNVTEQNIPMIHAALASTKEYIKTRSRQRRGGFYKLISKASKFPAPMPSTPNKSSANTRRPPMWPTWRIPIRHFCRRGKDCRSCPPLPFRRCSISRPIPAPKRRSPKRSSTIPSLRRSASRDLSISFTSRPNPDMRCPNGNGLDPEIRAAGAARQPVLSPDRKKLEGLNDWND